MEILTYLRQFRISDYALFDLNATFIGMYLLSPLLSKLFTKINLNIPKINWIFLALPIGIITHLLFSISTPMTTNFLNPSDHYLLKIVILILILLGCRNIKRIR